MFEDFFNLRKIRNFLSLLLAAFVTLIISRRDVIAEEKQIQPVPKNQPNIVIIVADDLGYMELGVQGSTDVPTPNIDSIANSGVRFTNGYVTCPVCSPTRAGLLTGRYQQRFGHEHNLGGADEPVGLSLKETTIADSLKKAEYVTGIFGKWHLGSQPQYHPLKRGFDEFFGFYGGLHDYMDYKIDKTSSNNIMRMDKPVVDGYTTDVFAREATDFIERHKAEKFFVYLPFNAVHGPLQATEKYLARLPNVENQRRRTFLAMLSALDDGVGKVLTKIKELELEKNTLIFFFSDNGGPFGNTSRNTPLRGQKGQVFEGGIRVPFFIKWTGHIPEGLVYNYPVISLDAHYTALAVAGGTVPDNLDGVNLLPYITNEIKTPPHQQLFWRMGVQKALRDGDWKILTTIEDPKWQLYNLAEDVSEKTNLAEKKREIVDKMDNIYSEWNNKMVAPAWKEKTKFLPKNKIEQEKK